MAIVNGMQLIVKRIKDADVACMRCCLHGLNIDECDKPMEMPCLSYDKNGLYAYFEMSKTKKTK